MEGLGDPLSSFPTSAYPYPSPVMLARLGGARVPRSGEEALGVGGAPLLFVWDMPAPLLAPAPPPSPSQAVREYPELVKKHMGSVVPIADNYFAALNSAVFSDGSFCYVPKVGGAGGGGLRGSIVLLLT